MIKLYNDHPALRKGSLTTYPDKDVLVFEKTDAAERFLVMVNVRDKQVTLALPENWVKREGLDELNNRDVDLEHEITLNPYEYLILRR